MGWAARANAAVRDGKTPARPALEAPADRPQPLGVYEFRKTPLRGRDGAPLVDRHGHVQHVTGLFHTAEKGQALDKDHYFDGRSVRRIGKVNGKTAKRARQAARRTAAGQ